MIQRQQLEEFIIEPVLSSLGMMSDSAVLLMTYTASAESALGTFIKQTKGPALGIYQMEPDTYFDIWESYLSFKPELKQKVLDTIGCTAPPPAQNLIWDLRLATTMARIQYYRWPANLPDVDDTDGLIRYYYKYWAPNPSKTSLSQAAVRIEMVLKVKNLLKE